MRSSDEIKRLVLNIAERDDRIRAVLLNGSRANTKIQPDKYQDFDLVFLVNHFHDFVSDRDWIEVFGEKLIRQLPDEMDLGYPEDKKNPAFHYLTLLKDGNRIDLTVLPSDRPDRYHFDSLTLVWLDKDNLFSGMPAPDDSDFIIKKPSQKQFTDTCNEFWWVSTYVAKGLVRNEIIHSKEMLEKFLRPMFMKIIEWYVGFNTNFSVSPGKSGKFIQKYLPPELYGGILKTYSDDQLKNNWQSLFAMLELFGQFAGSVAEGLQLNYNKEEGINVTSYIRKLYRERY